MLVLTITVEGRASVLRYFTALDTRCRDLSPVLQGVIALKLRSWQGRVFDSEGQAQASGRWPSLAEAYARRKEREYPGQPLMVRTGDLRTSLTEAGGTHIERVEPLALEFGTSLPYAYAHEAGRGVPKRAMLDLPGPLVAEVVRDIEAYVEGRE